MDEVVLKMHPAIEEAVKSGKFPISRCFVCSFNFCRRVKGGSWEDDPALIALSTQTSFLNELQAGVNEWTAALVTRYDFFSSFHFFLFIFRSSEKSHQNSSFGEHAQPRERCSGSALLGRG